MGIDWYYHRMRVTIDRVGRVVIPKQFRDSIGIAANSELEITADAGGLRLEPIVVHQRVIDSPDGFPRLRAVPGQRITTHDVNRLRDELQR